MTVLTDRVGLVTDGADADPRPAKGSETLSYEQARDKLAAVVKRLEAGGLTLEQSLELWERGERLATVCGEWLDGARPRPWPPATTPERPTTGATLPSDPTVPVCPSPDGAPVEQATARWAR